MSKANKNREGEAEPTELKPRGPRADALGGGQMTDHAEDNVESFERIRTARLRAEEIPVSSLEEIREAVEEGTYIIDFDRLATALTEKLS